jgi:large subunit ribosomal protein L24
MRTGNTGTGRSRIKRGDQVVFIAGKEYNRYDSAGKRQPFRGRVIAVDAQAGKIKVEGAMLVKKHQKPVPQLNREGGIVEREAWVSISNVAIVDPETGNPTRVRYEDRDGKKVRVAKSGKVIPEPEVFGKREPKKLKADEADEK